MMKTGVVVRKLSRSEWEMMLLCWKLDRPSARQVHEAAAAGPRDRDYRTVLATLNNIAAKGFLRVDKQPGPRNIPTNRYIPTLSWKAGLEDRIRDFLREDLGGSKEALELLRQMIDS